MKLCEIFDGPQNDSETSIQDMIVSRYEIGELTYDQALTELKKACGNDRASFGFWQMELTSAEALREPVQTLPQSKRVH